MFDAEDSIVVPDNLDDYIKKGIASGIKKKKVNRTKFAANAAVVCLLLLFTVFIRTSPVFAAYVTKIPGLEYLVRLINHDKGLQSAVENNFIQNINSSITKEGITFTIKDTIIDKYKALIFYSIENNKDSKFIELAEVKLIDEKGKELPVGVGWSVSRPDEKVGNKKVEDKIEISFIEEGTLPNNLHLEIKLRELDSYDDINKVKTMIDGIWTYDIPVNKKKIEAMEKSYSLNKQINIDGQKVTFKKVMITPIRAAVEVEYDENNSKKVLGYDDIKIVDEKGNQWGTIINGVSGSRKNDSHETIYFQSNYFNSPKHLYIKASNVRAVDKDKANVVVDIESSKLLKAPDEKLKLMRVDKGETETRITFSLERDKLFDEKLGYFIFSGTFKDSNGKAYHENHCETYSESVNEQTINFIIDNNSDIKGPIFLELYNYPQRIISDFEVRIK
ncbi:DUF4179 domain-containing protein [Clostridium swellfunianum]|uniref:DUF4179 domain-containing protein n=1 Tax=Clostridium swellfunianum TaxID=1367462 RepID=UPI00202E1E80|nr:DUF4179 domain-containing protein [Clostridium swellfunianum]MCM0649332.1 DUF4179 domain-containing protein [Clostridium swellfunianum]